MRQQAAASMMNPSQPQQQPCRHSTTIQAGNSPVLLNQAYKTLNNKACNLVLNQAYQALTDNQACNSLVSLEPRPFSKKEREDLANKI